MLALVSARWKDLAQAHGNAEDIPRLLEALALTGEAHAREELWFGLWATLCPDGRVFDAAYGAVPHLLAITRQQFLVITTMKEFKHPDRVSGRWHV